jgi:hypothetical protein
LRILGWNLLVPLRSNDFELVIPLSEWTQAFSVEPQLIHKLEHLSNLWHKFLVASHDGTDEQDLFVIQAAYGYSLWNVLLECVYRQPPKSGGASEPELPHFLARRNNIMEETLPYFYALVEDAPMPDHAPGDLRWYYREFLAVTQG